MSKSEGKWLSIESLKQSASYFGNCEKCNRPVTEKVYILRGKLTKSPFTITHTFGHISCLELYINQSVNRI